MYTVGLVSKYECCKTYLYDTLEEAKKELISWKNCFLNNNVVVNHTTITERDECENIISIKHCFKVKSSSEEYIMFLSKNK